MNDPHFFDVKNKLEESGHFKDLEYTEQSKHEVLKKTYFQEVVRKFFVLFLTALFLYLFVIFDERLPFSFLENNLVYLLLLGFVFILAVWLSVQIDEWLVSLKYKVSIQLVSIFLIILFFMYQLFTPYFYTSQYLTDHAIEKIETYFELSDENLAQGKREELIDDIFVEQMAFAMKTVNVNQPDAELLGIEIVDIDRNYDRYELSVKVERRMDSDVKTDVYQFEFNKEWGDFKITGYVMANEKVE